jgi:hypothetical protein
MTIDNEQLLRKRLCQLEYADYEFDYKSSGSLIARLVSDLLSATDSAKRFRIELDQSLQENFALKDQVNICKSLAN